MLGRSDAGSSVFVTKLFAPDSNHIADPQLRVVGPLIVYPGAVDGTEIPDMYASVPNSQFGMFAGNVASGNHDVVVLEPSNSDARAREFDPPSRLASADEHQGWHWLDPELPATPLARSRRRRIIW